MDLDLNLLRVMEAMFHHRTVSAAAATLGVTQPAVSLSLRRLRRHFGDDLFVRHGGAMIPTAAAERLRAPVLRAMETIRADIVSAAPFMPETSTRCFAISLSDLGDLVFLPDLAERLRATAPGVSIRSVAAEPRELLRILSEGSIDLALGHLTDLDDGRFFEQTLFTQSFVCLARIDHPAIVDTLTLEQFLDADHAVVVQEGRSQDVFERRVHDLGLKRRIVLQSPYFMSLPVLVEQSDMIVVVPVAVGRIYARLLGLKILPLPFDVPAVELKQFWHRRSHTDPATVWLRRQVANVFVGRDPTRDQHSVFWSKFVGQDDPPIR